MRFIVCLVLLAIPLLAQRQPPGLRYRMQRPRELALAPLSDRERAVLSQRDMRVRAGIHRELPEHPMGVGQWEPTASGASIWRMALRSPGSEGLRLQFSEFDIGNGLLWVRAGDQVAGP